LTTARCSRSQPRRPRSTRRRCASFLPGVRDTKSWRRLRPNASWSVVNRSGRPLDAVVEVECPPPRAASRVTCCLTDGRSSGCRSRGRLGGIGSGRLPCRRVATSCSSGWPIRRSPLATRTEQPVGKRLRSPAATGGGLFPVTRRDPILQPGQRAPRPERRTVVSGKMSAGISPTSRERHPPLLRPRTSVVSSPSIFRISKGCGFSRPISGTRRGTRAFSSGRRGRERAPFGVDISLPIVTQARSAFGREPLHAAVCRHPRAALWRRELRRRLLDGDDRNTSATRSARSRDGPRAAARRLRDHRRSEPPRPLPPAAALRRPPGHGALCVRVREVLFASFPEKDARALRAAGSPPRPRSCSSRAG